MELKRFITVFTTARYWSLGCDKFNPVQALPHFCFNLLVPELFFLILAHLYIKCE